MGALTATGVRVTPVRSATRAWGDGALLIRARFDLLGPLFAEAEGGADVVFTRDRLLVEPDQTIHRAPWLLGVAGIGVGISFP